MSFSLETWQEIVAFYEVKEVSDSRTLVSLATVSQAISDLALNRIWQELGSLEPVADVINAVSGRKIFALVQADFTEEETRRWVS